jgi:hypothetical protein
LNNAKILLLNIESMNCWHPNLFYEGIWNMSLILINAQTGTRIFLTFKKIIWRGNIYIYIYIYALLCDYHPLFFEKRASPTCLEWQRGPPMAGSEHLPYPYSLKVYERKKKSSGDIMAIASFVS